MAACGDRRHSHLGAPLLLRSTLLLKHALAFLPDALLLLGPLPLFGIVRRPPCAVAASDAAIAVAAAAAVAVPQTAGRSELFDQQAVPVRLQVRANVPAASPAEARQAERRAGR